MKIGLLGYGKMGKLVEQMALQRGHTICILPKYQPFSTTTISIDVAIDFSVSSAVLTHLEACLDKHIPLVIGTTGWNESLMTAKKMVQDSKGSCLYGANFSIGLSIFQAIVTHAAAFMQSFDEYDVAGIEMHHQEKKDSPSGTAKQLSQIIQQVMPRVQTVEFSSVRCGHIPGTHTILFDSAIDTITLSHQARNREGFAQGALLATEWLEKRRGFFTFDDFMKDSLQKETNEI